MSSRSIYNLQFNVDDVFDSIREFIPNINPIPVDSDLTPDGFIEIVHLSPYKREIQTDIYYPLTDGSWLYYNSLDPSYVENISLEDVLSMIYQTTNLLFSAIRYTQNDSLIVLWDVNEGSSS